MDTKVNIPQLPEQEARDFCSNIALKYNATNKNSPHIENLSTRKSIYGEDTIQWLSEFLWPLSNEVYIVDDNSVVLKFARMVEMLYIMPRKEDGEDMNTSLLIQQEPIYGVYGIMRLFMHVGVQYGGSKNARQNF